MKIIVLMTVEYSEDMPAPVFAGALMRAKRDMEDELALHGAKIRVLRVQKSTIEPCEGIQDAAAQPRRTRPETPAARQAGLSVRIVEMPIPGEETHA